MDKSFENATLLRIFSKGICYGKAAFEPKKGGREYELEHNARLPRDFRLSGDFFGVVKKTGIFRVVECIISATRGQMAAIGGKRDWMGLAAVLEQMRIVRERGHGIIGMKIIGEGNFKNPEDREKSIRFAMRPGLVDSIVIGFKSSEEIDEVIEGDKAVRRGSYEKLGL